jgi:hypothetical protein
VSRIIVIEKFFCVLVLGLEGPGLGLEGPSLGLEGPGLGLGCPGLGLDGPGLGLQILALTTTLNTMS